MLRAHGLGDFDTARGFVMTETPSSLDSSAASSISPHAAPAGTVQLGGQTSGHICSVPLGQVLQGGWMAQSSDSEFGQVH